MSNTRIPFFLPFILIALVFILILQSAFQSPNDISRLGEPLAEAVRGERVREPSSAERYASEHQQHQGGGEPQPQPEVAKEVVVPGTGRPGSEVVESQALTQLTAEVRQIREFLKRKFGKGGDKSAKPDPQRQDDVNRTALVGLLTVPWKLQRRALIRATYLQLKPPGIDFYFVFGRPNTPEEQHLLEWEHKLYNDIMIIDVEENMDSGKTYHYFTHVAKNVRDGKYKFIMKTDDDVWLHLPNLEKRLQGLPEQGTYFGRAVQNSFMAGMGYVLSWDLVRWIAEDPFPEENKLGQEDAMVSFWLRRGDVLRNWISEDNEFYDDPQSGQGWAHAYTSGTILIHRLKNETMFIDATAHFFETSSLSPNGRRRD
ncbi:uncharacterized protein EV422DRAFT_23606 [Fimicolochytrium jonesii]|uniref:uncharacterized protein n=1 Tax=Fimicolochytrium jonesii TaxID=1396493 RepID=UPI0022FE2585|nr:uncharacterized protein EV422DRAFT_23606 [Fimicolochytrium jonesii]KAI8827055.1 hypothetical protein EV422DRAFT_23606 [Fimicolochytrium jonesii]